MLPPKASQPTPTHPAFIDQVVPQFAPIDPANLPKGTSQQSGLVGNTPVTKSHLDPSFVPMGYDLEEHRAQHQSFGEKAAFGVLKAVGSATGMVGTIGALAYGAGKAVATGDPSDIAHNEWAERVQDLSNWQEETMPLYKTKEEKEANALSPDNLLTANFLFDGVVKNLGFSFGAGVLTKVATRGIASAVGRLALSGAEGLEALQAAKVIGEGSKLATALRATSLGSKFTNAVSVVGGSLAAGAVESQQESQQNYTTTYQGLVDQFHQEHPGQDIPQFKLDEFAKRASSSSLSTYLWNTALLGHDNFHQFGKSMLGGYKQALKQRATSGVGKAFQTAERWAGRASIAFSPSEAFEEGAQNAIQAGTQSYYSRKKDPNAWGDVDDMVLATTKGLHEALETKEGLTAIMTGGLSGGPSIAAHALLSGQGTGWSKQDQEFAHSEQVLADLAKHREENPLFAAQHDNVVRHTSYSTSMDKAVKSGDVYQYQSLRHDALKSRVQYHAQSGTLSHLQDELETVGKMPQEEFQKMFGLTGEEFTPKTVGQYVGQLKAETARLAKTWDSVETRFPGASQIQKETLYDTLTNISNRDAREKELNGKLFQATGIDHTVFQGLNPEATDQDYAQAVTKALIQNPGDGSVGTQDIQDFLRLKAERGELVNTYQDLIQGKLAEVQDIPPVKHTAPVGVDPATGIPQPTATPVDQETPEQATPETVPTEASQAPEAVPPQVVQPTPQVPKTPTPAPSPSSPVTSTPTATPTTKAQEFAQALHAQGVSAEEADKGHAGSDEVANALGRKGKVLDTDPKLRAEVVAAIQALATQSSQTPIPTPVTKPQEVSKVTPTPTTPTTPTPVTVQKSDPTYLVKSVMYTRNQLDPVTNQPLVDYKYSGSESKFFTLHTQTLPKIRSGEIDLRNGAYHVRADKGNGQNPIHFNLYTTVGGKEVFLGFLQQGSDREMTPEQVEANKDSQVLLDKVRNLAQQSPGQNIDLLVEVSASLDSLPKGVVGEKLSSDLIPASITYGGKHTILRQKQGKEKADDGTYYNREVTYLSGGKEVGQKYLIPDFLADFGPDAPTDGFLLVVPTLDGKGKKLVGLTTAPASAETFAKLDQKFTKKDGLPAFLAANQSTSLNGIHTQLRWNTSGLVVEVNQSGQKDDLGVLFVDTSKPITTQEGFLKALTPSDSLKEVLDREKLKVTDLFAQNPLREEPGQSRTPSSFTLSTTPQVWGPIYFTVTGVSLPVATPVQEEEVFTPSVQGQESEQTPTPTPPAPQKSGKSLKERAEEAKRKLQEAEKQVKEVALKIRQQGTAKKATARTTDYVKARKNLARLLPTSYSLESIDQLLDGVYANGGTWGAYRNKVVYLFSQTPTGTEFHEAFHAVYRDLLSPDLQRKVFKQMAALMGENLSLAGIQGFRQAYGTRYDNLSNQAVAELMVEEALADHFQDYMNKRSGVKGLFRKAFDLIRDFYRTLMGRKGEDIDTLFGAIEQGKYRSAQPTLAKGGEAPVWSLSTEGGIPQEVLASNGKPSALYNTLLSRFPTKEAAYKAYQQTQSQSFKRWFGNSKVVDENGEPKVVYHGTVSEFDQFDTTKTGSRSDGHSQGIFFTDNLPVAYEYTEKPGDEGGHGRVVFGYLRIENPLQGSTQYDRFWHFNKSDQELAQAKWEATQQERIGKSPELLEQINGTNFRVYRNYSGEYRIINKALTRGLALREAVGEWLTKEQALDLHSRLAPKIADWEEAKKGIEGEVPDLTGYSTTIPGEILGVDGVILDEVTFSPMGDFGAVAPSHIQYTVFEPNQIKSIDNQGTYSTSDNRVAYSLPTTLASGAKSAELVGKVGNQYIDRYQYYEGTPAEKFQEIVRALRWEESTLDIQDRFEDQDWLLANKKTFDISEDGEEVYLSDKGLSEEAIPYLWKEVSAQLKALNLRTTEQAIEVDQSELEKQARVDDMDDPDSDNPQDINETRERSFDQNSFTLTGVKSLSQQVKSFLWLLSSPIPGSVFRLPANVFGTFSLLQRNLKGLDTFAQMKARLEVLAQGDPTGVLTDLVNRLNDKLQAKEVDQYFINKFTRAFKTEVLNSLFTELDQDKGTARVYSANRNKEEDMLVNRWEKQYNALLGQKVAIPARVKAVKDYLDSVEKKHQNQEPFTQEDAQTSAFNLASIGLDFSPGFLNEVFQGQNQAVDIPTLTKELARVLDFMRKGENPFGEAKSRLTALATQDVLFRADIFQASYQNAEGETVFGHTAPSFEYVRARKLQDGTHGLDFSSPYYSRNYLVQHHSQGKMVVGDKAGLLQLAGGMRERSQEEGVTPKQIDPRTQIINDLALYREQGAFRWAVHEAKATTTLVVLGTTDGEINDLPVFVDQDGITLKGRAALLDMVHQDLLRQGKVEKQLYGKPREVGGKLPVNELVGGYHFLEKAMDPSKAPKGLAPLPGGSKYDTIPQKLAREYMEAGHRNLLPTGFQYTQFPELNSRKEVPTEKELDTFLYHFLDKAADEFNTLLASKDLGTTAHLKLLAGEAWVQDHKDHLEDDSREWKQNFLLHDLVVSNAMSQLIVGEQAYYLNHTNFTKRMAGMIAAGNDNGEGPYVHMTVADEEGTIEPLTFGEGTQAKHVGQTFNPTDAQSYMSGPRWYHTVLQQGYMSAATQKAAYKVAYPGPGEVMSEKEADLLMTYLTANPIKGVYDDGETYLKTSYLPLFHGLTSDWDGEEGKWVPKPGRKKLHHLREIMSGEVDGARDTTMPLVDEVSYVSASKLQRKGINTPQADGTFDRGNLATQVLENKYWRLQVENPSGKTKIPLATQMVQFIDSEMSDEDLVEYQGETRKLGEVRQQVQKALARNKVLSFEKANKILGDILDTPEGKTSVYLEMVQDLMKESGSTQNQVDFFTQSLGQPKYSLDLPFIEQQVEKAFLSFFNKQVFQQKVPGLKLTLVSSSGFQVKDEVTGQLRDLKIHRLENGKIQLAEVILSEELLRKKGMTLEEYKSMSEVDQAKVVTMLGFRIPTQSHHSMIPFKVVDWVPAYYGSIAVAPKEITWLSGADYDVDSLFVNRKEFRVLRGPDKEFLGVSIPGEETTAKDKYDNWKDYVQTQDTLYSYLTHKKGMSPKEAFTHLKLPLTQEAYEALPEDQQVSGHVLSNQRFDGEMAFILNPANVVSLFTPATIDSLKFLKGFANSVYGVQENSTMPYHSYATRSLQWEATTTGKANVGGAANAGKVHAWMAKNEVRLRKEISFAGVDINIDPGDIPATGFYHLDYGDTSLTFQDGKWALGETLMPSRIADQLSTMTSGMTDDAKERLSFALNLTPSTLPVLEYGISIGWGINRVLGLFATQPILKELAYRQQQADAQVKDKGVSSYKLTDKMVYQVANLYEKAVLNTSESVADVIVREKITDQGLLNTLQDASTNQKRLQSFFQPGFDYLNFTKEDTFFLSQQLMVLEKYAQLEEQAKYFGYVNKLLNSNKGLPVSVQETKDYFVTPWDSLHGNSAPFDVREALSREDNVRTNLDLILPSEEGNSVLNQTQSRFLVDSPLFNTLKKTFKGLGGRNAQMQDFQMGFLTHLTMLVENQQVLNTTGKALSEYQYLLTDPTRNITHTLAFLMGQPDLKGNLFLNQLVPKGPDIKEKGKTANPFYRLEYNTRAKNEADFVDQLAAEWLDLYSHPDPEVVSAAKELKYYLAIKDSLQFKNSSFISLAKPNLFHFLSNGIEEDGKKVVGLKEVSSLIKQGTDLWKVEQTLGYPYSDFYENPQTTQPASQLVLDFFRKWYSDERNHQSLESWDDQYKKDLGPLSGRGMEPGVKVANAVTSTSKPQFPLVVLDYGVPYLLEKTQGVMGQYRRIKVDSNAKFQAPWAKGIVQPLTLPQVLDTPQEVPQPTTEGQDRETYKGFITSLQPNQVFVFGSNPEGRHGAGAAKVANTKFGAKYGVGRGLTGQSYALPTKNLKAGFTETSTGITYSKAGERSLTPDQLKDNIQELYQVARENPTKKFLVAYSAQGSNLNGYSSQEMADLFSSSLIPGNMVFEEGFNALLTQPQDREESGAPAIEESLPFTSSTSEDFIQTSFGLQELSKTKQDLTLSQLLAFVQQNGSADQQALGEEISRLLNKGSKPVVYAMGVNESYNVTDPKEELHGRYDRGINQVGINLRYFSSLPLDQAKDLLARTINHELLHHLTVYRFSKGGPNYRQIEGMMARVRKVDLHADYGYYGMSSPEEFITAAFTDREFQEMLKQIPGDKGGDKSVWTKFLEALQNLFGQDGKPAYSLLEETVGLVNWTIDRENIPGGTISWQSDFSKPFSKQALNSLNLQANESDINC